MDLEVHDTSLKLGAITLIDVLGWKGIWRRIEDPITLLSNHINGIDEGIKNVALSDNYQAELFRKYETKIVSISDTIAIITFGPYADLLDLHGYICNLIIANMLESGLPARGATNYGYLSHKDSIIMGPAVDEVASWYESVNWIGVHLCPSALYYGEKGQDFDNCWESYNIVIKNQGPITLPCNSWPKVYSVQYGKQRMLEKFVELGPITPDIADKTQNTLKFYDYVLSQYKPHPLSKD